MWLKLFFALWGILFALDIPWVLLNSTYGVYKGFVNGIISNRPVIGLLWAMVSGLMALCITGIFIYFPREQIVHAAIIFGFTVYFIFNATSLTMFQWSIMSAFVDTLWGALLCGTSAAIGLSITAAVHLKK